MLLAASVAHRRGREGERERERKEEREKCEIGV
jgi:hypothetical protein